MPTLKYQNLRADYIKAWWNAVNWDKAGEPFDAAKQEQMRDEG
jgi:Fe-Mn family superoxide dismutase